MKLFKYPVLVFDNIIKQLDLIPLVSLSFCSKKSRERIKKVSFATKGACFFNEFEKKRGYALEVDFLQQSLLVSFQPSTNEFKKTAKKFSVRIGNISYDCRYLIENQEPDRNDIYLGWKGYKQASIFFHYILDLVRTGITEIVIDLNKFVDIKQRISEPCFKNVQKIGLIGEKIPGKKVSELYDCFEKPILQTHVESNIKSLSPTSKLLKSENLCFDQSENISIEHLLNFNGKYISLYDSLLFEEHIISFLKNWLDGNYANLEGVVISRPLELGFETEKIIDEFDTKRWNPAERAQNFIFKASYRYKENDEFQKIDCTNGHDLERSDGLLATIMFGESDFNFYVWHTRFP